MKFIDDLNMYIYTKESMKIVLRIGLINKQAITQKWPAFSMDVHKNTPYVWKI